MTKKDRETIFQKFDFLIYLLAVLIVAIGVVAIKSATFANTGGTDFFLKQLIFAILGLIVVIFTAYIPPRYIAASSYYLYGLSILMLIAVLLVGKTINGNKSWFYVGGFGIQPSEFAKIATVLAVSFYLMFGEEKKDINKLKPFLITSAIIGLPALLIKLQHDTGTTIIFVFLMIPILWGAGLSPFMLFAIITPPIMVILSFLNPVYFYISLLFVAVILFFFKKNLFLSVISFIVNIAAGLSVNILFSKLALYQQQRIMTVFDPTTDPLKSGYNVIQAKVAIGSGGFWGKGYLMGSQTQLKFIPEQWTDFIFCMIGEEFGFVGALILITIFTLLILRMFFVSINSRNDFMSLATTGFAALFLIHLLINIGMTINIMPVIGIPLPMVSYGVSSLGSFLLMIGLSINTYVHRNTTV